MHSSFNHYLQLETKLLYLTGFTFERLLDMFAKGYTLEPPTYTPLSELTKEVCEDE